MPPRTERQQAGRAPPAARAAKDAPPITADTARTLAGLFAERVARTPDALAYRQFEQGHWQDYRWRDMAEIVARWRCALAGEGLAPGERVALSLPNGVDWVAFDQAALALGLVTVPLYATDSPGNVAHIVSDSGARLLLLDSDAEWAALRDHGDRLEHLQTVICRHRSSAASVDAGLTDLGAWLYGADAARTADRAVDQAEPVPTDPDALATLIYTSGTTGAPKGVMLSHRNILADVEATMQRVPALPEDLFLSFLPLAHAFERSVGYYLPMLAGAAVAYARGIAELREDLLHIRPTTLLSVPRVYDKIYRALQDKLGERGIKRRLFDAAVASGWRRFEAAQGRAPAPGVMARLVGALLHRLVGRPVLARLGGRLRVAVSGGAPLSPTVGRCFVALGLPLTEGYGLTEAAPVVTNIAPAGFRPGFVGLPLPGLEVKLGPAREILVRGASVMAGYWQQPEATAAAIDADGWLHTGDIGEIGADGQVGIRGRLKEIIVTSTGEKIAPTDLEAALAMESLFDQAMVVGEGQPFPAAVLVLADAPWRALAAKLGRDPDDAAALTQPDVVAAVQAFVDARLADFPRYAQVRAVHLTRAPWTVENGLITPTMKLKRDALTARFAGALEHLYARPRPRASR
jgi:long-chain acyl-CoA synthetase